MTRNLVSYPGDLGRPIKAGSFASEWPRKFGLLLDHYGIDRKRADANDLLLYAMIVEHVPGMNEVPVRGRGNPGRWTPTRRIQLVNAIERERTGTAMTVEEACRRLVKTGRWKRVQPASLAKRYREALNDSAVQEFIRLKGQPIPSLVEATRLEEIERQIAAEAGKGPKAMKVGSRAFITKESAAQWRREREIEKRPCFGTTPFQRDDAGMKFHDIVSGAVREDSCSGRRTTLYTPRFPKNSVV